MYELSGAGVPGRKKPHLFWWRTFLRLSEEALLAGVFQRMTSATFPTAINSAILAKSLYITRSLSTVGDTDRIAAWAVCPRLEVFRGARKSIACATAIASIA